MEGQTEQSLCICSRGDEPDTRDPPRVSVQLSMEPAVVSPSAKQRPTLYVTATSHASGPITVLTYWTILYPQPEMGPRRFKCRDLTNDEKEICIQTRKVLRRFPEVYHHNRGCAYEKYIVTLLPETPTTFQCAFDPVKVLKPGHRYLLDAVGGAEIYWWRHGTRQEVLADSDAIRFTAGTEFPIRLSSVVPVEIVVEE